MMTLSVVRMNRHLVYGLLIVMVASSIGCASRDSSNAPILYPLEALKDSAQEKNNDYVLKAGDTIAVKFFYNPELNELVTIRPDGKISLQLIGEVVAEGLTPSEVDGILTEKYSARLREPEITVIVKEFAIQEVYVGGEVMKPGTISWKRDKTALEAIFEVGGFTDIAQPRSIIVISKGRNGMAVARTVNLKDVISKGTRGPQDSIVLQPFDIIFVPKTFIAKANQFIRQYIVQMLPVNLSAGFSYALVKDGYLIR